MVQFTLDLKELEQFETTLGNARKVIEDGAWNELLEVAETLDAEIDEAMPVDTGRAKASWGKYRNEYLTRESASKESDSIWIENKANLEIIQGSRVEYIDLLNDGHSRAAPAGFIDSAQDKAEQVLEIKLADQIEKLLDEMFN